MHKLAFVIPYFGKLPTGFPLWLASCRQNPSVDFLLFTDDRTGYDYPENVRVEYTTFEAVRALLQNCFDFRTKYQIAHCIYMIKQWFFPYSIPIQINSILFPI